ncbi:MAG: methylenetetrahydrofolate reductase, partial [Elusimicrobiales bacterium]|nr:methylenetetrahydrofolate reductase [Elusimicrobiales bacterium]
TLEKMIEKLRKNNINIPIIAGILPITSKNIFNNIVSKIKNIIIPKKYSLIIEKYYDDSKKQDFFNASIEFISEIVEKVLKTEAAGIHFFTLNKNKGVEEIIKRTQICKKLN